MATEMASQIPTEQKTAPASTAALALDGLATNLTEVLAGDITRRVKQNLATVPASA
jgi:hypothetical protein